MDIRLAVPGIIGLVVFVIIFNVYHIIRIRKKRTPGTDAINAFKSITGRPERKSLNRQSQTIMSGSSQSITVPLIL